MSAAFPAPMPITKTPAGQKRKFVYVLIAQLLMYGRMAAVLEVDPDMIARIWHGMTKASDVTAYLQFLEQRAIPDYCSVPGNRGVHILHRIEGDRGHFLTLTFWDSRNAIEAFAGTDIDVAKYYPEDKNYLLEFEPTVTHYIVADNPAGTGFR